MKILMVLTSHAQLGSSEEKTGFGLEGFATPYYMFKDAGAAIILASPEGGEPPIDPREDNPSPRTEIVMRLRNDAAAQLALADTVRLRDILVDDFDAVFYAGGLGPLWDLANDNSSIKLIEQMLRAGKPVAAVGHAVGVFRYATSEPDGASVVDGKAVTGFSNTEEEAMGLTNVVPFLVEDMLRRAGGKYTKAEDWQPQVVSDGALITGQNSASSELAAKVLMEKVSFFSAAGFVRSIPWNTAV